MKRKLLLTIGLCLLLTGCSESVSQEDYDKLKTSYNALEKEKTELQNQIKETEEKYNELKEVSTKLQKSSQNHSDANVFLNELPNKYALAWAHTVFGDSSICFTDSDKNLEAYVIVNEDCTSNTIVDFYSKLPNAANEANSCRSNYGEYFTFEQIGITLIDKSNTKIVQFVLRWENNEFVFNEVLPNTESISIFSEALDIINKK